jgi:RHS repeat-associated protein
MTFPGGVDSLSYDEAGRLVDVTTRADGVSGPQSSSVIYDVRGRVTEDYGSYAASYSYDAFGHLVGSDVSQLVGPSLQQYFTRNAFGGAAVEQDWTGSIGPSPGRKWNHFYSTALRGALTYSEEEWDFGSVPEPEGWVASAAQRYYDGRGNLIQTSAFRNSWTFSGGIGWGYDSATLVARQRTEARSYYGADGLLRVHQVMHDVVDHTAQPAEPGDPWGAYEEYWYDALGRRVLKRSVQADPVCKYGGRCYSSIERVVWDGMQIVWEVRQADAGDTKDPGGSPLSGQTGHIGYVYAGGGDTPLGIVRNDVTIALHRNWKGLVTFATDETGDATTCAPASFSGCESVSFPGTSWNASLANNGSLATETWYGTVTMGFQDRTGMMYRRNRYFDPSGGQFTQADPIGVAGGLSVYAYAGGDPVNFSDPLGLCPVPNQEQPCIPIEGITVVIESQDPADDGCKLTSWCQTYCEFSWSCANTYSLSLGLSGTIGYGGGGGMGLIFVPEQGFPGGLGFVHTVELDFGLDEPGPFVEVGRGNRGSYQGFAQHSCLGYMVLGTVYK